MAVYDLRLSPEQFYALTPRQFNALAKRSNAERRHQEFLHAQTVWATITFSMCAPKKPVTTAQFMPSEFTAQQPKRKKRLTDKQIAQRTRELFKGLAAASR